MAAGPTTAQPIPAVRRIDGMTGEVWRGAEFQADIIEITGTVRQERREIPIPGTKATNYKPGRVTREGSYRYQKVDDARELEFFAQVSKSLAEQRALRDAMIAADPNADPLYAGYSLLINLDDPQAWGASKLSIQGVQSWEMPIGFNLNDLVEREIPITWENEDPILPIVRPT